MIVHYIWKACNFYNGKHNQPSKEVFWIECKDKEFNNIINNFFLPQMVMIKLTNDYYTELFELEENYSDILVHYLMVAKDLTTLDPSFRAYPISAMHPGGSPFNPIKPIFLNNIGELPNIKYEIVSWEEYEKNDLIYIEYKN